MKQIVINLPKSHRNTARFKAQFPNAKFYGATSLGSGCPSYLIDADEYEQRIEALKALKITKAKNQPFM